jgi:hypothetical protein
MKANSTARENQAEIYSLDQSAYEEARKIKVCTREAQYQHSWKKKESSWFDGGFSQELDASIGSVKARTTKLQTELDELEQSEPTRSPDFVIESSV